MYTVNIANPKWSKINTAFFNVLTFMQVFTDKLSNGEGLVHVTVNKCECMHGWRCFVSWKGQDTACLICPY